MGQNKNGIPNVLNTYYNSATVKEITRTLNGASISFHGDKIEEKERCRRVET